MPSRLRTLVLGAVLLAGTAGSAGAQSFPPTPPHRHRTVAGWQVDSVQEEELSRAIYLKRRVHGVEAVYSVSYWHGNRGPYSSASFTRRGELCGGDEWRPDPDGDVWRAWTDRAALARDVRARLAGGLAGCGVPHREVAAALTGFEPAFAIAFAWGERDRRYVLSIGRAIANYGSTPGR